MKISRNYPPEQSPSQHRRGIKARNAPAPRKILKYFRTTDYFYAVVFFGFIIYATLNFERKLNEVDNSYELGKVTDISYSSQSEIATALGGIRVTTDKMRFSTDLGILLKEGDDVSLQKMSSGKYRLCASERDYCAEIENNIALAIRPGI